MANTLYDLARKRFLEGNFNLLTDNVKAYLVDTGSYTANFTTHEFISDVPTAARIAGPILLPNRTTTGGAFDADDITFPSVSGASIEAIILFKDTGTDGTSPLIAYIDSATGLPITPNGGDIIVTWDNGVNKIFKV